MVLKSYLEKSVSRLNLLENIFSSNSLIVSCDKLSTEKKVNQDVLYFKNDNKNESELIFMFGFDFFVKELEDQEFKKLINQNHLAFKIHWAYKRVYDNLKIGKKVRISDILNQIQNKEKDSLELHQYIEKILSLAYYLNWDIEKDNNAIETDYFVEIPDNFLVKIRQRFNFDIIELIYENSDLFIFLNGKGKIVLVFKNLDEFTQKDVIDYVFPSLKHIFGLEKILKY